MKAREELDIEQIKLEVKDWQAEVERSKYHQYTLKYNESFIQWFGWLLKIANEIEFSSDKGLLDNLTVVNYEAIKQVMNWKRSHERLF